MSQDTSSWTENKMDLQTSIMALREHAQGHDIGSLVRGDDVVFTSKMDACIQRIIENQRTGTYLSIPTHLLEYMG